MAILNNLVFTFFLSDEIDVSLVSSFPEGLSSRQTGHSRANYHNLLIFVDVLLPELFVLRRVAPPLLRNADLDHSVHSLHRECSKAIEDWTLVGLAGLD